MRGVWPVFCALQRTATEKPDDQQLEVAILAVREALSLEAERETSVGA